MQPCALVGLDTLATVASDGAQGFTWLIALGSPSSSRAPTRAERVEVPIAPGDLPPARAVV